MAYPSIEQYQELLQNPKAAFADAQLARGRIKSSGLLGTPQVVSGGFALTYALEVDGTKFAVRCFHRAAPELEQRYAAVSRKLKSLRSPYFVDFEFQPKGIKAPGGVFPIVKMAWATGVTLSEFVETNHADKSRLGNLQRALRQLATDLQAMGIAHGDIQEGNLMVSSDGSRLQLIDYDGMYVPELASMGGAELGHRDYQHPGRDAKRYDATLDRFSFISLDLSLRALSERPSIWTTSQSGAGVIVFKANDFADPAASATLAEISRVPALQRDAANFASVCRGGFAEVPTLAEFLAGQKIPQQIIALGGTQSQARPAVGYISQYPVVDGSDYPKFAQRVGELVELVGRVTKVRTHYNRARKPMLFINLGPYPGCVSLTLWSDALATKGEQPTDAWEGQWISIRGLVEPPHPKQKSPAAFIQVGQLSQIVRITEKEARFRLAGPGRPHSANASPRPDNRAQLEKLLGTGGTAKAVRNSPAVPPAPQIIRPQVQKSANQQILERMQQRGPGSSLTTPPAPTRVSGTPRPSPLKQNYQPPPTSQSSPSTGKGGSRFWLWVAAAVGAWFVLKLLGHR